MYLVKKKISGKEYYYARESVRKGKRVMQKVILYLGSAETVLKKLKSKGN